VPKTNGILESSLYVSDVPRSVRFYQETFGFRVIKEFGERGCAMRSGERQVLLLFKKGASRAIESLNWPASIHSRLPHRPSWPTGIWSEREESKWKRSEIGNWEDGASTFATRIDI
jgi:hypothetical protein